VQSAYGQVSVPADRYARWADEVFGGWTADRLVIRFAQRSGLTELSRGREKKALDRYRKQAISIAAARVAIWASVVVGLASIARPGFLGREGWPSSDGARLIFAFLGGVIADDIVIKRVGGPTAPVVSIGIACLISSLILSRSPRLLCSKPTEILRVGQASLGLASVLFLLNSIVLWTSEASIAGSTLGSRTIAYTMAAPIIEEVLFRGCLFGGLRSLLSFPAAVAVSALVFALVHPPTPLHLTVALVTGLVLAWGYERWARLLPCIVAHCVWNSMTLVNWRL
jgi:membrane protease YdiL (CAAX protease family)